MEITLSFSLLWLIPAVVLAVVAGQAARDVLDPIRTRNLEAFLQALSIAAVSVAATIACALQV